MGITRKAPPEPNKTVLHGTAVLLHAGELHSGAVFIRGLSGAGKSDLALRLIDAGAQLICDDQVLFEQRNGKIYADSIDTIRGLLEVRGVGLMRFAAAPPSRLHLVVDLVRREDVPRLPDVETIDILGAAIPRVRLHAFDMSTPVKIRKKLEALRQPELMVD
ncbi:MAG: HPr kinase/phosphatase C-terminal domain-containing protein [Micavibrio sp.]|nr:HPr kinase/phosphatase C-terminal domain-containing protein [Micavibrio sp.]